MTDQPISPEPGDPVRSRSSKLRQPPAGTLNCLARVYLAIDNDILSDVATSLRIPVRRFGNLISGSCRISEDELRLLSMRLNHNKDDLIDPTITSTRVRETLRGIRSPRTSGGTDPSQP